MKVRVLFGVVLALALAGIAGGPSAAAGASTASPGADPGVGKVPQGTQADAAYAQSVQGFGVTNVDATAQRVSCYRPEVDASAFNDGPNDGYTGVSACPGATTGEDTGAAGPYPTQAGSNPGYPAAAPQLVKDHSESDIRVDPTNPLHLIGSVKWFVSAEGYNHLTGFYESFDGGTTWPVQGHVPGYEGWTDNTDPVGAFDGFGNWPPTHLPCQFFYNAVGATASPSAVAGPNPVQRPGDLRLACGRTGPPRDAGDDADSPRTSSPLHQRRRRARQTVDHDRHESASPHYNRIYAMWVVFHGRSADPVHLLRGRAGQQDAYRRSAPIPLPTPPHTPQGATYLLPHVDPGGVVYTTITNEDPAHQSFATTISVDRSTDGGKTWSVVSTPVNNAALPPLIYPNTTFRDGITDTFAVGNHLDAQGRYPLYIAYEDHSAGIGNVLLTASYDGGGPGQRRSANDNAIRPTSSTKLAAGQTGPKHQLLRPPPGVPGHGTAEPRRPESRSTARPRTRTTPAGAAAHPTTVNTSIQFYRRRWRARHNVRLHSTRGTRS
jgi:hypothetical protein